MRYLIHTEGKVINLQGKSYMVKASGKEEAQEAAKKQFIEEYGYNGEIYTSKARKINWFTGISILAMVVAIGLSFIDWKSGHATISIKPDLISCVIAFAIYSAYVIRIKGLQRMTEYTDLAFMVLLILLFSSFIQCILLNSTFKLIVWEVPIDCRLLLIAAIFLSWLGMKLLSVGCMLVIVICAFFKILMLNKAMGNLWGPAYVICAAVGIITYLIIEPAVQEMLPYYQNCAQRAMMGWKIDASDAGNKAVAFGEHMGKVGGVSASQIKKSFIEKKQKSSAENSKDKKSKNYSSADSETK